MRKSAAIMVVFLTSCSLMALGSQQIAKQKISIEQVRKYIFDRYNLVKECDGQEAIGRIDVQGYDFDGDGHEEVIVNAMTCAMGNGGNNVLSVYKLDRGELAELPIQCLGDDQLSPYCRTVFKKSGGHLTLDIERGYLTLYVPQYNPGDSGAGPSGGSRVVTYKYDKKQKMFIISNIRTFR